MAINKSLLKLAQAEVDSVITDGKATLLDEERLTDVISVYLKQINRPRSWDGYFHVSSIYKCSRDLYWYITDPLSSPIDARTYMVFHKGHTLHDMIQKLLIRAGRIGPQPSNMFEYDIEVKLINEEHKVMGSADAIITLGGKKRILEFKTSNANIYRTLVEPIPAHTLQCMVYMWMADLKDPGVVLYLNKDTGSLKEFHIPYRQDIIDLLIEKLSHIKESLQLDQPPSRFIKCKTDELDKYCPYAKRCRGIIDDRKRASFLEV